MIVDAEPAERVRRSGSSVRSVAIMAGWYGAALVPLAMWLGPQLAKPQHEPVRQCTAKTLACFQWSTSATIKWLVRPMLLSCLVMSLLTLVLMMRRGSSTMAAGTVAALTGWLAGPFLVLLVLVAWAGILVIGGLAT